jgi:oligosaccharyltransferase complex subunit beta
VLAVPHGVAQSLGNTNPLLTPILRAPSTAYVYNPKEEAESVDDLFATGSQISLISAMQARNSARFTVLGSLEMLQDKWFGASVKGLTGKGVTTVNKEFAKQLTEWTFKEVGVLKAGKIEHHEIVDSGKAVENTTQIGFQNPTIYRIKNDVVSTKLPAVYGILISRSLSPWNFQPGTEPDGCLTPLRLLTLSNWSFPCSHHSNDCH